MNLVRFSLVSILLTCLLLIGWCIADTIDTTDISILALQESDLPAGSIIDLPFTPISEDIECDGDLCVITGGDFSALMTAETGNISFDQEILVYTKPVTKEYLDVLFKESFPELSSWNIGLLEDPEIGDVSMAFNYTVPEDIGPINPPIAGYVILFGIGDIYEIFKSTGGSLDDIKDMAEIAAGKIAMMNES